MADILWVDDEEGILELGKALVSSLEPKHNLTTTTKSAQGVELCRQRQLSGTPFDLVITDLAKGSITYGFELIEAIRAINPQQKIIVISADATRRQEVAELNADFLEKPFGVDDFKEVIVRNLKPD